MFILKLQDCEGSELNIGDIVRVESGSRGSVFFSEVKYLEKEQAIAPFHTFSFHKFYKVDAVPENAVKSLEERYNIWYLPTEEAEATEDNSRYLIAWRACEHLLKNRCYTIQAV